MTDTAAMATSIQRRVFLSHAAKDKPDIQKRRQALADRGIASWEDVTELRLGDRLDAIRAGIRDADGFVLLRAPKSIGSDAVELALLLEAL